MYFGFKLSVFRGHSSVFAGVVFCSFVKWLTLDLFDLFHPCLWRPWYKIPSSKPTWQQEIFAQLEDVSPVHPCSFHHWNPRYIQPQGRNPQQQGELNHQKTFHFRRSLCIVRYEFCRLRSKDVNFYVVLSLRSFNRGLPLLPDRKGEIQITLPTQEDPWQTRGWGFGRGKKTGVLFFFFGGPRSDFWVWICMCSQVENSQWRESVLMFVYGGFFKW